MFRLGCAMLAGLPTPAIVLAQGFDSTEYHAYLPPPGKPTEQTKASLTFRLFSGHETIPSETPGVSAQREARLRALAARFSPILVPTNFSVPRDFEDVLAFRYEPAEHAVRCRGRFDLAVDVWNTTSASSKPDPRTSLRVPLDIVRTPVCPKNDSVLRAQEPSDSIETVSDSLLRILLLMLGPKPAPPQAQEPGSYAGMLFKPDSAKDSVRLKYTPDRRVRQNADTVLYFDMPGSERSSWRDAYQQLRYLRSRIYVHPFVHEHREALAESRFEFVLQYWFFYPLNDGVNNHEGDWEHINVSVSTRHRLEELLGDQRLLTADEVSRILGDSGVMDLDSLAISAVDYYFHGFVVTVDYKDAHQRRAVTGMVGYTDEVAERFAVSREGISESENRFYNSTLSRMVYERMQVAPDLLRTHPIVFIGGMSVSPVQIFDVPGSGNANSHGSYPFTGVWRGVGPLVAREKMRGDFDAGKAARLGSVPPGRDTLGMVHYIDPCYRGGTVGSCMQGDSAPIVLLPDWEQMVDRMYGDPGARELRRRWAWFALPIRWGYPTTASPGARIIRGYDFGHTAPVGPAFNAGWNRVGVAPTYARYPLFPLTRGLQQTPWDNIYNVLGFGNVVPTLATLLPPVTLAATLVTGVVHGRRRAFQPTRPGMRNVEVGYAPSWGYGGTGFARRLPGIGEFELGAPGDPLPEGEEEDFVREPERGSQYYVLLHWGRRWGTETIFSRRTGHVFYHGHLTSGSFADVHGDLEEKELLGVFRFGTLAPFGYPGQFVVRFGYGWTWHRIQSIRLENLGGPPLGRTTGEAVRGGPHFLPNTLLGGAAFESTFRLFNRPKSTIGARVAATVYTTRDLGGRTDLTVGAMLGF